MSIVTSLFPVHLMPRQSDIRNSDGSYMNEDEIVQDIIDALKGNPGSELEGLLKSGFKTEPSEFDLTTPPFSNFLDTYAKISFGRYLRNTYGLWQEDNPHVCINPDPNADGIIDHPRHPDNLSGTIIDRLIEYYRNDESKE